MPERNVDGSIGAYKDRVISIERGKDGSIMENTENKKLSRMDLFSMAVGQIIGVGLSLIHI